MRLREPALSAPTVMESPPAWMRAFEAAASTREAMRSAMRMMDASTSDASTVVAYPREVDFGRVRARCGVVMSRCAFGAARGGVKGGEMVFLSARCEPCGAFRLIGAPGTDFVARLAVPREGETAEPFGYRVEFDAAAVGRGSAHAGAVVLSAFADAETMARARDMSTAEAGEFVGSRAVILATRACALVMDGDAVKCVLDVEAAPFYPRRLRELFNSGERSGNASHAAWRWRNVDPGFLYRPLVVKRARVMRASGEEFVARWLEEWSNMLTRERLAQQGAIEKLDMFDAKLKLEKERGLDRKLSIGSGTPPMSLYSLKVPGLSEQRPLVLAGDVIFVRLADCDEHEFHLVVQRVDTRRQMLYVVFPASEMYRKNGFIRVHVRFTINLTVFKMFHDALMKVALTKQLSRHILPGHPGASKPTLAQYRVQSKSHDSTEVLNAEQLRVVEDVLSGAGISAPYIVWGPPGTGKTLTLVECVARVLESDKDAKILLAAPAPYAADILCSRLAQRMRFVASNDELLRINDERRMPESVKADVRPFSLEYFQGEEWMSKNQFSFFMRPTAERLKRARVVVCSCTSATLLSQYYRESSQPPPFTAFDSEQCWPWKPTHIFIDEAAQALVPETLIPLSFADLGTSIILAGDSKQLGPIVHDKTAAKAGLRKSLLELWMDHTNLEHGTQLRACYRSHPDIVSLPSRLFYDGAVVSCASEANVALPHRWDEFAQGAGNGRSARFLFYGVKGRQRREGNTESWTNPVEAAELVELLADLLATTSVRPTDVAVMATYRRQVTLIRLALRQRDLGAIRVGTVDDFQGQEEKIVFISTVVTRPTTLNALDSDVGFLNNPKRFNVAISRAMALNVIIGHPLVLLQNPLWSELLRDCVRRDAFRGAGSEYLPRWAGGGGRDVRSGDADGDADVASAVTAIAELALLGAGAEDALEADDHAAWNDWGDAPAWRVAI